MKFRRVAISLLVAILPAVNGPILFFSTAYSAESASKKVTVAYPAFAPALLWFLLEKELGFFREGGLRPEFVLVKNGGLSAKGLIAGNFDYAHNTGAVMDAIVRGRQPLKIVFTAAKMNYWIVSQPGIRSVTDLKGKAVATGGAGSITEVTVREILKRHGMDPFRDVALVGIGFVQDRLSALASGAVQAAVLTTPLDFKAVQMGYRKLAKATDYVQWPASGIATREDKIVREPLEVSKMTLASLKGLKFILAEREYVLSKMTQMFHLSQDEALQAYTTLREEVFVPSGYLTEEEQRAGVLLMRQTANVADDIPPERVFDYHFVKQAEQELKGWKPQASK
jgi:NitT/TauT family transport system substrate-binding protein